MRSGRMHALLPSFSLTRERHEPKFLIGRDRFVCFFSFFFLSMNRLKFERNCDCSEGYTFKVRNIYIFFLLFPIADYSQLGWKNRRGPIYLQRIRIPSIEKEN